MSVGLHKMQVKGKLRAEARTLGANVRGKIWNSGSGAGCVRGTNIWKIQDRVDFSTNWLNTFTPILPPSVPNSVTMEILIVTFEFRFQNWCGLRSQEDLFDVLRQNARFSPGKIS